MRVWALVTQKGGSGKSLLSVHLAVHAEQLGLSTMIADVDPQGSCVLWSKERKRKEPAVIPTMPDKLREVIAAARTLGADLAIIDTPSKLESVILDAVHASDLIICPSLVMLFDLGSLASTIQLLTMAKRKDRGVVVLNRVPSAATRAKKVYEHAAAAVRQAGIAIADGYVSDRPTFATSLESGRGVTESNPKSEAAEEIRRLYVELDELTAKLTVPQEAAQ